MAVPNASAVANVTGQMAVAMGEQTDKGLKLVTRIMALVAVLVVVGLIVFLLKLKPVRAALELKAESGCALFRVGCCRARYWKHCCLNFFGCGCIPKVHQVMGYEELQRPKMSLALTFMASKELQQSGRFYFEVWTEPEENPRKNTTSFTGPGDANLNSERVELCWHGDEDELFIELVEYTGTRVGFHRPVGEVRLKLRDIDEIVKSGDGLRRLSLQKHDEIELKKRTAMRRVDPVANPQAIVIKQTVEALQTVSYQKFGEEYPDQNQMKSLMAENTALREKLGANASSIPATQTGRHPVPQRIGDVIVKFSLEPKEAVDHSKFSTMKSMQMSTFTPFNSSIS
jgi:hypothetical protein